MNIFSKKKSFWGVLGKRTLNPEELKCHEDRIHMYNKEKQWIISFTYM